MGFFPFGWSWKTKGGGRVYVAGFIITPFLLTASYFLSSPSLPRPPEQHRQQAEGQMNTNFMLIPTTEKEGERERRK
jgi:hypothetical protein